MNTNLHAAEWRWPLEARARVNVAGFFAIGPDRFETAYRIPHHSVHLYTYAAQMSWGGRVVRLAPGDLTLTPAGVESRYALPFRGQHWCIHFQALEAGAEAVTLPLHLSSGSRRDEMADHFRRVIHWKHGERTAADNPIHEALASAALQELLLSLALLRPRPEAAPLSRTDLALERFARTLEEHLTEEHPLVEWARLANLSPAYLARQFRRRYGETLARYIRRKRIERAQALLQATQLPVKVIGAQVGYPDPQHFNKRFREITGSSPSRFRQ